jgi:hypothetical protein
MVHHDYFERQGRNLELYGVALGNALDTEADLLIMDSLVRKSLSPDTDKTWLLVFENNVVSVFLRRNKDNETNLAKVESYYRGKNVPFETSTGFDPRKALDANGVWLKAQLEPPPFGWWPAEESRGPWEANQSLFLSSRGLPPDLMGRR